MSHESRGGTCTCQPGSYMARCAIHGDGARRTFKPEEKHHYSVHGVQSLTAERDAWIKSWNRLEAAISHHKKAKSDMFVDEVDEALYAARDRILKERAV